MSERTMKKNRKYKEISATALGNIRESARGRATFSDVYPERLATRCLNVGAETLLLSEIRPGSSSVHFEWVCEKNPTHLWAGTPNNRTTYGCKFCWNEARSEVLQKAKTNLGNLLKDRYPDHFAQLIKASSASGREINGAELAANSRAIGIWDLACGHGPFSSRIGDRIRADSSHGCKQCSNAESGKRSRLASVVKKGSLRTLFPQIAAEWLYPVNGYLNGSEITSSTCSARSNIKVMWQCLAINRSGEICGHQYLAVIADRTADNHGCSICKKLNSCGQKKREQAVLDHGSIYDHPLLSQEFRRVLNLDRTHLTDLDISVESNYRCEWECSYHPGQIFEASPSSRIRGRVSETGITGCMVCGEEKRRASGFIRALENSSSITELFPDLAAQWEVCIDDPTRTADNTTAGSHLNVRWKCGRKAKHASWVAPVYSRTSGAQCPSCNFSKGELATDHEMRILGLKFTPHLHVKDLLGMMQKSSGGISGMMSYDFAIMGADNLPCGLVEFHGKQHYEPVNFRGSSRSQEQLQSAFELGLQRDHIKRNLADKLGIPLLEIPYWQIDSIKYMLTDFLGEIHGY